MLSGKAATFMRLGQMSKRPWMYRHFDIWLGSLPHRHKIVIPGNHGYHLEDPKGRKAITNAALLVGSSVEVEGLRICSYTAASLRLVTEVFANSGLAEYIQTGIRLVGSRS
ncbi:MAG TPA: hypothetical protein VFB30_09405 [Spirochaetia bacterium]|nr:hypothetical protein [Spirochaetia bacterium]